MPTHKAEITEYSLSQLEQLTGLTYRPLKQRLGKLAPIRKDGRTCFYDAREAIRHLLFGKDGETVLDLTKERAKLTRVQTEKTELEVEKMKGEMVDAREVESAYVRLAHNCKTKILTVPNRIALELEMKAAPFIANRMAETLREVLDEFSEYHSGKDHEERGEGAEAAAEVDAQSVG